jgi:adenine-specific DNA-methyltransferase
LANKGRHEPCGITENVDWEGGGFFKYYSLESYEEVLQNMNYKDGDLYNNPNQDPYHAVCLFERSKAISIV